MSRRWQDIVRTCRCDLPSAEQAWRQGMKDGSTWRCGTPGCGRAYRLSVEATAGSHRNGVYAGGIYTRVSWS